jgi:GntR family transcriptional repressor for pyruvate dehydrogenase complex
MAQQSGTHRLDSLTQDLTQRIMDGTYAPGAKLPTEIELQKQWGVSRSVVREAMKVLASQGLVRIEQGRGTFVADTNHASLKEQISFALRRADKTKNGSRARPLDEWSELLDVRRVLEVEVAARAARNASPASLDAMQAAIDVLRNQPNEPEGYVDADIAFHRALAEATGNPLWPALLNSLNDLLRRYREAGFVGKDGVLFAARQHQKILDAVRARDSQAAHDAMESHLKKSEQDLKKRARKTD